MLEAQNPVIPTKVGIQVLFNVRWHT